jgi:hypothetical protein
MSMKQDAEREEDLENLEELAVLASAAESISSRVPIGKRLWVLQQRMVEQFNERYGEQL